MLRGRRLLDFAARERRRCVCRNTLARSRFRRHPFGMNDPGPTPEETTTSINRVMDRLDETEIGFAKAASRHILERIEWLSD